MFKYFAELALKIQKLKEIRKSEKELYALTDNELKDIGIHRSEISRVVRGI